MSTSLFDSPNNSMQQQRKSPKRSEILRTPLSGKITARITSATTAAYSTELKTNSKMRNGDSRGKNRTFTRTKFEINTSEFMNSSMRNIKRDKSPTTFHKKCETISI